MKKPRGIFTAVSLLLLAGMYCPFANTSVAAQASKVLMIHQINEQRPTHGGFVTQGYVAKIYTAPACPPGAVCKPSMPDNIVISEDKKSLDTYNLSNKEMVVFTQKTAAFKKAKKYRFQIKITQNKTTNEPLNDVVLLHFRALD